MGIDRKVRNSLGENVPAAIGSTVSSRIEEEHV